MDPERQNRLLNLLVRTDRQTGNLKATLEHIAQIAQKFFLADICVIFAMNPITGRFIESPASAGSFLSSDQVFNTEGLTRRVLRRNILMVSTIETAPKYQSQFTRAEHIRSFVGLALSMRQSSRPLGVLYINFRNQRVFSIDEQYLFQMFADLASFLLQETWLLWRSQRVAAIGQEITREVETVDMDIFFQRLQTCIADILDISHSLLLLVYHHQTNTFDTYLQDESNFILLENEPPFGACQHAMEIGQTIFIEHLSKEEPDLPFQLAHIPGTDFQESFIFTPLLLNGKLLGVLSVQHPDPYAYTQEDRTLLELLANHTALALHNMQIYHTLSQLNEISAILTGQLGAEQTLQALVEKIRKATDADLVVLYPFEVRSQRFVLPPCIDGDLLDPTSWDAMSSNQSDGAARQILHHISPVFIQQKVGFGPQANLNDRISVHQGNFGLREQIRSTVVLPLHVEEETVGALFLHFRQQQRFDAAQRVFIEGLGHSAAIAIRNAQLLGNLSQRRLREQIILQHIDHQLNRTLLDLKAFLHTILNTASEHISTDEAVIFLYKPHEHELEAAAAHGLHADMKLGRVVSLQQTRGITRWVFEHKRSARVGNVHLDPQWRDLYISIIDEVVSELDVPLLDEDEVVGVLNFESTQPDAFSREDEDFLNTLAGQIVLALKNAQSYEREKQLRQDAEVLVQEARALNEISKEITSQLDLARVFDLILEKALKLTGATLGSLHLYHSEQNELWRVKGRGVTDKGERLCLHQGIVGEAAARRDVLNVPDVSQPPWNDIYVEVLQEARSELAVPMLEGEGQRLRGVLNVESPFPGNFQASAERQLKGLADLAVIALQNAERYDQANKEAQRFALLYKAGQELGKITEKVQLDQAYETILHIAAEHSQCQVAIRRYDDQTRELVLTGASQSRYLRLRQRTKADEGIHGQVAQERRTIMIHDTKNLPPDIVPFRPSIPSTRSTIVTPILFKDRYYGTLRLSHQNVGHFQMNDQRFFEGLALQLATAIYRLETVQERQDFQELASAAEAMSEVGQTAFELVHRLENDLGLVKTYANHIREEIRKPIPKGALVSERLDHIVQAVGKALHLTGRVKEDLFKWGQTESSNREWIVLHPSHLLEEVRMAISLPATVRIDHEINPTLFKIRIRYHLIKDILHNLITNAIEAMPEGGQITLRVRNSGRFVALEVSDTGTGIPEEYQAKIFNLFFSTKKSTGFGLWSARRNALNHHGDLTVKSELNQRGTTFTLLLPKVEEN